MVTESDFPDVKCVARRFGHGLVAVVELVLLYLLNNLAAWNLLPYLTERFAGIVPWVSSYLLVAVAANGIHLVSDDEKLNSFGRLGTNLAGLIVTLRVYQIFPFDLSMYEFGWAIVVKVFLVIAAVNAVFGLAAAMSALTRRGSDLHLNPRPHNG